MFKGWFGEKKTQFNLWLSLNTKLFGKRFYREKGMWPVGKRFVLILFGVKTDPRKSGRCGYFGGHDEFVFDNRPCGIVKPVNFPRRYILPQKYIEWPFLLYLSGKREVPRKIFPWKGNITPENICK